MVYTRIIVVCALTILSQVKSEVLFRGTAKDGTYAEVRRLQSQLPGGEAKTVTTITSSRILAPQGHVVKSELSSASSSGDAADLASRFLGGLENSFGVQAPMSPLQALQYPQSVFNQFLPQQQPYGYNPYGGSSLGQFPSAYPQPVVPGIPQYGGGSLSPYGSFGNDYPSGAGNPYLSSLVNSQDPLYSLAARSLNSAPNIKEAEEKKTIK